MLVIIGIIIVFGAVAGGYLMEHGQLLVLFQPAELVIIAGAALGTVVIANPLPALIRLMKAILGSIKGSKFNKAFYTDQLRMLNDLFQYARKNGMPKLEGDVDNPQKSTIFSKYPKFLSDHHAVDFLCDTLRLFISSGIGAFELDQLMELDLEVHHHEVQHPVHALSAVSDALPGLGIVAAVLGVVITMGAIGGPPEQIGHKVAAALVGTFLGILLCYGVLSPLAANMTLINQDQSQYYHFLRTGMLAFIKGSSPITAVEFARRSIPSSLRPSFKEMEAICRGGAKPATKAA